MKQLLDLCGQVADAAGDSPLRETARETSACARRVLRVAIGRPVRL